MTPQPDPVIRAGTGRLALVAVLALAGAGLLALAAYRALAPAPSGRDLAQEAQADLQRRGFHPLSEPLEHLLNDPAYKPVPTQVHPLLGETAPDFTLEETGGLPWRLAENLEKGPVVLVFYYGYHCDHCVSQLFGLNRDLDKFRELGARMAAVSADPPELTRKRFAQYGPFSFPVLADPGNKVARLYGVYQPRADGKEGDLQHGTFLISRQGKVVWVNRGDEPFTENQTLLIELARSEGRKTP